MCLETILTRRSVRVYEKGELTGEELENLLQAAAAAPSAGNQQPWHFVIIRQSAALREIAKIHQYAQMAPAAAAAILVCGDERLESHKGFWVQDCSAATQNILLAAHAMGLGGVWVGIYPQAERVAAFRELFALPTEVVPFSLIPVGRPGEKKEPANRFSRSRVHYEKWGGKPGGMT